MHAPILRSVTAVVLLALVVGACNGTTDRVDLGPDSAAVAAETAPAGDEVPPTADVVPRPAHAPTRAAYPRLQAALRALLEDPDLAIEGAVAVAVEDERGYRILEHEADRPMLPASTMKVVTAAAALVTLGPDHRYRTPVVATAPLVDGVVDGDLVIVGVGDPALTDPRFTEHGYPERPRTPVEDLVAGLVDAGLREVRGDVVGDPSFLADEPLATGTQERHLRSLDMSRTAGLTIDYGMDVVYHDDGRAIGTMAEDPAARTAEVVTEMLEDAGVRIRGEARSGLLADGPSHELAAVESPPLATLLRYAVQRSDNHLSDGIFRTLGALDGDPTWSGSASAITRHLSLDWGGAVIADGSGLSRDNRLTPRQLTTLDRMMTGSAHAAEWHGLMAVAGESGTLRRRLRGTLADRLLRGKTGTLDDVRALTATLEGTGDRHLHLTVIGNDLRPADRDRVRLLTDEIALRLAEELRGCVRIRVEEVTAPDAPEDEEPADREVVRCP